MSKKMLVNATHLEENRVAIVADGILTELDIEVSGREPTKGNIYKAVVVRVEAGLQAAFVDYGAERLGFLQIDEINFETVKPGYAAGESGRSRTRINDLLHRGQELLVQITKEERGNKGAALTTYLSLAGRFMVCMPGSQTRGVSRKVESDAERKQLKKAMEEVDLPEGFGYIVRTAGLGKTKEELQRDFNYLKRLYDGIRELGANAKAPALIYKESNLVIRSIRDYFTTEMDEVLIDDPDVFKEAQDFFQRVMPEHAGLVKLHQERRPIFSRYQIEDQIETINQNKVPLSSGGSIVIDPTEALVSIDVNSGKMTSEQGVESTAFKTNLEAADEVGRQLRLRDLGGLIVIDFIDMRDHKHNRAIENQLRKSLESDKARISVGRISKFGLLEMSRQRIKAALADGSSLTCPHCQGSGRIKSPESLAVGLVRRIHAGVAKSQISHVDAKLPLDVASYLLNYKREDLLDMERRYNVEIHVHGFPNYLTEQIEIEFKKREKEKQTQQEYVEAGNLPATASEIIEAAPQSEPEEAAEANDKPKKKRRRRRRKPAAEKAEQEAAQQPADEKPATEQREENAGSTDQAAPENEEKTGEQGPDATPPAAEKPKRRRPPRKKPESRESDQELQAAQESSSATTSAEAPGADQQTEPEPKPKPRSRRRSSRSRPAPKPGGQGEIAAADDSQPGETAADSSGPTPEADEKATAQDQAKPRRRRAPRKKKTETKPVTEASPSPESSTTAEPGTIPEQPAKVPESHSQEEKPAAQPQPKQRPRRTRSVAQSGEKSKQEPTATAPEPAAANQTGTAAPDVSRQAEPEKPKRRRTPRKKTATQDAAATPATETAANATEGAESGTKPAPRRRTTRRKQPTAKDGSHGETDSAAGGPDQPAAGTEQAAPAEKKPKRAPRRKTANSKTKEEVK